MIARYEFKCPVLVGGITRAGLPPADCTSLWRMGTTWLTLTCLILTNSARAQQPTLPRLGYVYPAGGRQGTTFQVTVGGQNLASATNVFLTGSGLQATVLEYNRPMPQNEFNTLRDELKTLQEKRTAATQRARPRNGTGASRAATNAWTSADERRFAEIRTKILKNPPNRQASPALAETLTLKLVAAPEAAPGDRELRLGAPSGLSNPLRFCVGQLPEFAKPLTRAANPDLERLLGRLGRPPAMLNGQLPPGGVDRFRFRARQGQQLVIAVRARQLIPYLADAVPGWFQATITLFDAKGRELAYNDDFRFHPDPALLFKVPRDAEYVLEIKDAIYRGREDFVYRIALGELPFVTGIFPLGGPADVSTTVEVVGWNLPTNRLTLAADPAPGLKHYPVLTNAPVATAIAFAVDNLPECLEAEPNNAPTRAQPVPCPRIVNGRIDPPGDRDVFRLEGRAGQEIVAEVWARRLDSPLDSGLKLTDAQGTPLACNDDHEDKGSGWNTHHADAYLRATLPADATYYLHLGDTQGHGGPEYAYRLRVSAPRPDFELRVVPASLGLRAGASAPLTVYVLRRDGFSNAVTLALADAPAGFKLSGAQVAADQDQARFTLTAPATTADAVFNLALLGRATLAGREIVHPALPAEAMMQAFAYRHLVPAREFVVAVSERGKPRAQVKILSATPIRIPVGGMARVHVGVAAETLRGKAQLELSDPPEGLTLKEVVPAKPWGTELVLQSDAAKAKAGLKGNLIVNVFAAKAGIAGKAQANRPRVPLSTLPAIPFEITPQ